MSFFYIDGDGAIRECTQCLSDSGNRVEKERVVLRVLEPSKGKWSDSLEKKQEGVWEWRRTYDTDESQMDYCDFSMEVELCDPEDFYMIPCVNYNGNGWGEGGEPKGITSGGVPWRFAGHRSGVPGGTYAQTNRIAVGLCSDLSNPMRSSMELRRNEEGYLCLSLHFPETEKPRVYCARDKYEEQEYEEMTCISSKEIVFRGYLFLYRREKRYEYGAFLRHVWELFRDGQPECLPEETIWRLGCDFIQKETFFREGSFSGFCMGLTWNGERWEQKRDYLEIGWVGQNASLAVSMIYDGLLQEDQTLVRQGIEVLDCWAQAAPLPNGLFRCRYDKIQTNKEVQNREEQQDAANLYSVVAEYLEAYHLLNTLGIQRENYRRIALSICNFMKTAIQPDGKLAKAWYNDGSVSAPDGVIGSYMTEALCIGYKECQDQDMLLAAQKSFDYYFEEFCRYGYTTAGALDTCCVDKESAIPLLRSALSLRRILSDHKYLEKAETVSDYLASWQYQYNVPYTSDTILGKMNYQTRGGTAVSVQHHHIDHYGLEIVEAWRELADLTGDAVWRERAEAIWRNSMQNISDGNLMIRGQMRPRGSQDEGILQTRWHTKKGVYFGVSEWLVVWNSAFRLKLLRKRFLAKKRQNDKTEKMI